MSVYPPGAAIERAADLSDDGRYRYSLMRRWSETTPLLTFVMLNPSTADADLDDPTIRRCVGFAVALGYGGIEVVNLYAFRATDPADMRRAPDPVGPGNNRVLTDTFEEAHRRAAPVIAGWGGNAKAGRVLDVLALPHARSVLHHLGLTKAGSPRHPLYLPSTATPERYAHL